jgi:flagellar basal-body rod protein FlgC
MDSLISSIQCAGSGLAAQSKRIQIISENIANANSTASTPGENPYQRKIVSFTQELEKAGGASRVAVSDISRDPAPFPVEFSPGSPSADASGYVKLPNVNAIIEMADMREANRSYEANLQVIKQVRDLLAMSIDLMRPS